MNQERRKTIGNPTNGNQFREDEIVVLAENQDMKLVKED
jgi:hypothetical protein